jgi:histidyl-tRNA synthetase
MKKTITESPINGIRDIHPCDMIKRNYLFDIWSIVAKQHNFKQYEAPLIERTELYTLKGGDDIIKEMYYFETERQQVCLRPEVTPSLVRMISKLRINQPLKWFSIGQCWRYETVTTYRKREHYQLNCDIVAGCDIKSELEILSVVVNIFKQLGFTSNDIKVRISHRGVIYYLLKTLKLEDNSITCIMQLLDKISKISKEEFLEKVILIEGVSEAKADMIINITKLNTLKDIKSLLITCSESKVALNELESVFGLSEAYEIGDWLVLDLSIVRGLSYYTGLVFECFSTLDGFNRAICGGGRYDNIMATYGFKKQYSFVGFGMGDVVLLELLNVHKKVIFEKQVDYCLASLSEARFIDILRVANLLRNKGYSVDVVDKTFNNDKNALKYVDTVDPVLSILFLSGNSLVVRNRTMDRNDPKRILNIELSKFVHCTVNDLDPYAVKEAEEKELERKRIEEEQNKLEEERKKSEEEMKVFDEMKTTEIQVIEKNKVESNLDDKVLIYSVSYNYAKIEAVMGALTYSS